MFDVGWSELLIFAVVTLIFVGPKELPVLMRTVGRYVGVLRRQADEFRSHFDAAMQEAELDQMGSELESVGKGLHQSLGDASSVVDDSAKALDDTSVARESPSPTDDEMLQIQSGKTGA